MFAEVAITLGGNDLASRRIRAGYIVIRQPVFRHHTFSVECLSLVTQDAAVAAGASSALDQLRGALGDNLEIRYRWTRGGNQQVGVFAGIITSVRAERGEVGAYSVILEGHSPTIKMDSWCRNRIWAEATAQQILQTIAGENGDLCQMSGTTSRVHEYTVQQGESDFEFLLRLCQRERLWAWYDGAQLTIANQLTGPTRRMDIRGQGDGTLRSFAVRLATSPGKFQSRAWDIVGDNAIIQNSDDVAVSGVMHPHVQSAMTASDALHSVAGNLVPDRRPGDAAGLENEAQNVKHSWAGSLVVGEGQSDDPGLLPGGSLEVGGMSADDGGRYLITEVTHFLSGDGADYRNHFLCVPEAGASPLRDRPVPRGPSLWGGIIVSTDDPQQLGRVQVQFHHSVSAGIGDPLSAWARLVANHSGSEWGSFVLPELGDEVVVAALDGDQENLVVLGSVPNGSGVDRMGPIQAAVDAVGGSEMSKGSAKVFLTRSGNRILLVDKGGEETIEITSPQSENRVCLTLKDGPKIEMTTSGEFHVKAEGAINLESSADISIKAQGTIKLESGADVVIDATGNGNLKAAGTTTVKGMEVKVEGGGTVTCNPGGVEVKGPLIRIN